MANEKKIRLTTEIRKDIDKAISDYVAHRNNGKLSASLTDTEKLQEFEAEYAHSALVEHFTKCSKATDKMRAVLRDCTYTVIAHKDSVKTVKEVDDKGVAKEVVKFERSLIERKRYVSLKAYDAFCNKTYGAYASRDFGWVLKVEDASRVLTAITSDAIGFIFDPSSYRVSKGVTNTFTVADFMPDKIVGTIQGIVDDIIYEEKDGANRYAVTQYDANFVLKTFTGFGGVGKVKTANKGTMDSIILSVLLHLVTGLAYEVVFPKVKANQD